MARCRREAAAGLVAPLWSRQIGRASAAPWPSGGVAHEAGSSVPARILEARSGPRPGPACPLRSGAARDGEYVLGPLGLGQSGALQVAGHLVERDPAAVLGDDEQRHPFAEHLVGHRGDAGLATRGWPATARSISVMSMLRPPRMMTSFSRPMIVTVPSCVGHQQVTRGEVAVGGQRRRVELAVACVARNRDGPRTWARPVTPLAAGRPPGVDRADIGAGEGPAVAAEPDLLGVVGVRGGVARGTPTCRRRAGSGCRADCSARASARPVHRSAADGDRPHPAEVADPAAAVPIWSAMVGTHIVQRAPASAIRASAAPGPTSPSAPAARPAAATGRRRSSRPRSTTAGRSRRRRRPARQAVDGGGAAYTRSAGPLRTARRPWAGRSSRRSGRSGRRPPSGRPSAPPGAPTGSSTRRAPVRRAGQQPRHRPLRHRRRLGDHGVRPDVLQGGGELGGVVCRLTSATTPPPPPCAAFPPLMPTARAATTVRQELSAWTSTVPHPPPPAPPPAAPLPAPAGGPASASASCAASASSSRAVWAPVSSMTATKSASSAFRWNSRTTCRMLVPRCDAPNSGW